MSYPLSRVVYVKNKYITILKAKALQRQWREIYLSKESEKQISCRESAFAFKVFQFRLFRLISSDTHPKIGWRRNYDLNVIPSPDLTLAFIDPSISAPLPLVPRRTMRRATGTNNHRTPSPPLRDGKSQLQY